MLDTSTKDFISIWMGISNKADDDFYEYTKGIDSLDPESPICKDFGSPFIDLDFFVVYRTPGQKIIPIEELVKELVTYSKKTNQNIIKKANNMGVIDGNSLYYYRNATFHEESPGKLYNDLKFIGSFFDPVPKKYYR